MASVPTLPSDKDATITYNQDILSLHKKHIRFKFEIERCQSANNTDIKSFDTARFNSYITDLKEKLKQIMLMPEMDLPEFHPNPYTVEPFGPVVEVENELLSDLLRYLEAGDYELINSASSRNSTSLISHDYNRYSATIQKLEDQLAYADKVKPIDRPESSPKAPMSEKGNVGV
jgi:hypothetical protein